LAYYVAKYGNTRVGVQVNLLELFADYRIRREWISRKKDFKRKSIYIYIKIFTFTLTFWSCRVLVFSVLDWSIC